MNTFESFNLSEQLMRAISRMGFKEPTQIQKESIPLILEGKDVIGESATGSGKTLAFGVGIIKKCKPKEGVQAIVLVPTRELAEQVKNEMIKIAYGKPIKILAIYGGVSINPQIEHLRKSEVVIATPGRLLDHLNRRTINTSKVKILVLDEADRMVDMGFIHDVEEIVRSCPRNRQTLVFSATIYGPTKKIVKRHMKEPIVVHGIKMVDPTKLKQTYFEIPPRLKKELLVYLLKKENSKKVMVFCNTRRATDMIADILKANDIKSASIHGGLNQVKRLKTIDLFHKGKFHVLVCTDVAARGLHIEGVTHIYNFDMPKEPGDYVHRVGRTARAGKNGLVINIVTPRDYNSFSRIESTYREFNIQKEEGPILKAGSIKRSRVSRQEIYNNGYNKRGHSKRDHQRGNARKRGKPSSYSHSSRDSRHHRSFRRKYQ